MNINHNLIRVSQKRNSKLRNITKYTNQSNSNSQIQYYEPNTYVQMKPVHHSRIHIMYN